MMWLVRVREWIRSGLLAIPSMCVLVSVGIAVMTLALDRSIAQDQAAWYLFSGSADGARALLSTTSAAMLTFMALVFSITIVALQLASGQFSPRVQRAFLRDTLSKLTLGVFIGTFTYSVLVLRVVRAETGDAPAFVPRLATMGAVVFVLLSVGFFVRYIDHIARSIRAVSVIRRVASETTDVIGNLYPETIGEELEDRPLWTEPTEATDVHTETSGIVVGIDGDVLLRIASEHDLSIRIVPLVGDFVATGSVVARLSGGQADRIVVEVRRAFSVGPERSMRQDVAFGLRQLVDIADRALSPGINDPTTAVQVLDALEDILRRLIVRRFPSEVRAGSDGRPRVYAPAPEWSQLLGLSLDEIRISGSGSLQVARRMRALLDGLDEIAPRSRKDAVRVQLERLQESIAAGFDHERDRAQAAAPSRQGQI